MSKYENYTKEQLISKITKLESKKNYGLVWDNEKEPEKIVLECQNNIPILKKIENKTIHTNTNKPNNILIEGDNYHALQVLNYTHKGQVDVIYIDPPYNTGNKDFKYNDSFVDKEDAYRHSKWLNFMEKRLSLARELLSYRGTIFMSIDENEFAQLKLLSDRIFGESNYIVDVIWNSRKSVSNDTIISLNHNHTFFYAKDISYLQANKTKYRLITTKEKFSNPDNDIKGSWIADPFDAPNLRPNLTYPIRNPNTGIVHMPPKGRCWRTTQDEYERFLSENKIIFGKTGKSKPQLKRYFTDAEENGMVSKSIWDNIGTTTNGTQELENILGEKLFNNPKPVSLILRILEIASFKNSIILDFFAGSGTTGHAVLALNKEDGGNRQFILCTNNENDICTDVTYPRLSKVINGYTTPKDVAVGGLSGNLDYYKTDLVPTDGIANISDTTREELTKKAGNMIAIKENTHAMIELNEHYQIFKNETSFKQTAIYFTEDLSHFDELIQKVGLHKTKLYIFSFGKIDKSSFKYLGKNFEIEDIPEPIIEIYKEINKEGIL